MECHEMILSPGDVPELETLKLLHKVPYYTAWGHELLLFCLDPRLPF